MTVHDLTIFITHSKLFCMHYRPMLDLGKTAPWEFSIFLRTKDDFSSDLLHVLLKRYINSIHSFACIPLLFCTVVLFVFEL